MTQARKDAIYAITEKMKQNAPNPIPADIIHNCDLIDEAILAEPVTEE